MATQLEVAAELNITINGSTIFLGGNGTRLEADLPSLRTVLLIRKLLNRSLGALQLLLCSRGLTLDLRLQDADIGCIGYGARPTLMGWLAGSHGIELHIFRIVWAACKSWDPNGRIGRHNSFTGPLPEGVVLDSSRPVLGIETGLRGRAKHRTGQSSSKPAQQQSF
jgi:hypothetical protein